MFQSLFWWIQYFRTTTPSSTGGLIIVSILVLVDSVLQAGHGSGLAGSSEVSILVLVDSVLQVYLALRPRPRRWFQSLFWWIQYFRTTTVQTVSNVVLFQSLFWWIQYFREIRNRPYFGGKNVSILVLVDSVLQASVVSFVASEIQSFNPCFGGFSTSGQRVMNPTSS